MVIQVVEPPVSHSVLGCGKTGGTKVPGQGESKGIQNNNSYFWLLVPLLRYPITSKLMNNAVF